MKVTTSKSKNSESFYITQSYIDSNGKSTSKRIRKLGTLKELTETLGTDRDGVMEWAREQARLETENYKKEKEAKMGDSEQGKDKETVILGLVPFVRNTLV